MDHHRAEYDPFAGVYDRYWGKEYHKQAFPVVDRLLLTHLPAKASVLDVCCGTGRFTRMVQRRGFRLAGVDASEKMLAYAQRNVPSAKLARADVRSFFLRQKFDGAYSVFESLNHVPDLGGLEATFLCVRKHLRRGSLFLFDLNREEAFLNQWDEINAIVDVDAACIAQSDYNKDTRLGTCRVTTFVLAGGVWMRNDFTLRQTYHRMDDVHSLLLKTGFTNVSLYDGGDMGMDEHTALARTFFVATAA